MVAAPRAAVAVLTFFAVGSSSASGAVIKMVGSERFCVPESRLVSIDVPYTPKSLPDDGFVFELPIDVLKSKLPFAPGKDIRGKEVPLTGSVSTRRIVKHSADSHARRVAASNTSIVETISDQFLVVFESEERKNWVIWKPAKGAPLTRSSINDSATHIASCSARGTGAKMCNRVVADGKYAVSYYFDYANVGRLGDLDKAVVSQIQAWRCPNGA